VKLLTRSLVAAFFIAYIASLFLPAFMLSANYGPNAGPGMPGIDVLFYGGVSFLLAPLQIILFSGDILRLNYSDLSQLGSIVPWLAWLANPLIWVASFYGILMNKYRTGAIFSAIAFIIGFLAFGFHKIPEFDATGGQMIVGMGTGFYLWEFSFVILFIYCLISGFQNNLSTNILASTNSPK
jgi:hypothetical protein